MKINEYKFFGIKEARDWRRVICKASADNQPPVIDPRSIFREQSLSGRKQTSSEDTPLTSVRVTGQNKVNVEILDILRIIFGMMIEQNFVSLQRAKLF